MSYGTATGSARSTATGGASSHAPVDSFENVSKHYGSLKAVDSLTLDLRRRGHLVNVRPAWSLGRVSAVSRRAGILRAAANPRGMQGYAVGR